MLSVVNVTQHPCSNTQGYGDSYACPALRFSRTDCSVLALEDTNN